MTLHLLGDLQTDPLCLLLDAKEEEDGFDFYKCTRGTQLRTKRSPEEKDSWSSHINLQENLNFELTEHLLKRDYFKPEEMGLTLILNLSLPSSLLPPFPPILESGLGTHEEIVEF